MKNILGSIKILTFSRALRFSQDYWGLEVDFIVYGEDAFLAIEVKRSKVVSGKDVRSLRTFREDYPQAKACLLYGGKERMRVNDVLCLPCEEFPANLIPGAPAPID